MENSCQENISEQAEKPGNQSRHVMKSTGKFKTHCMLLEQLGIHRGSGQILISFSCWVEQHLFLLINRKEAQEIDAF